MAVGTVVGAGGPIVAPDLGASGIRHIGARTFDLARHVVVMAIINRTRDSFFDKGRTFALDVAVAAAEVAISQGAEWVDIGGVPFSPLAEDVDVDEEVARVVPVIAAIRQCSDVVISVDTVRSEVARAAVAAGADVINDTSGLHDPSMAEAAAETGACLILTHSKAPPRFWLARPTYADVVAEVRQFLADRVERALASGVPHDKLIIDPGHDLNKNTHHSLELTRRLCEIATLGFPMLVSVSNKDFIGETLGLPRTELRDGTVATAVVCILHGARILRVHEAQSTVAAVHMVESILGWRPPHHTTHNMT